MSKEKTSEKIVEKMSLKEELFSLIDQVEKIEKELENEKATISDILKTIVTKYGKGVFTHKGKTYNIRSRKERNKETKEYIVGGKELFYIVEVGKGGMLDF